MLKAQTTKAEIHNQEEIKLKASKAFPGGPVVENLPYNAGDVGLTPGRGTKIPHTAGKLIPCITITQLTRLN